MKTFFKIIGIIILVEQVARKYYKIKMERFWLIIGSLFTAGGIWELYETRLPLVPVLLIVAGFALLVSVFLGKK